MTTHPVVRQTRGEAHDACWQQLSYYGVLTAYQPSINPMARGMVSLTSREGVGVWLRIGEPTTVALSAFILLISLVRTTTKKRERAGRLDASLAHGTQ